MIASPTTVVVALAIHATFLATLLITPITLLCPFFPTERGGGVPAPAYVAVVA